MLRLEGPGAAALCDSLCRWPCEISADQVDDATLVALVNDGFVCHAGADEVALIRTVYQAARAEAPVALTITTTMDCNLGCYYCYEERSTDQLKLADMPSIVALARERLQKSGKKYLHVDWYGGEPLLNFEFLAACSAALQDLANELKIVYRASIISNGTVWPEDVGAFIRDHRIQQVQISFDGLEANHNRRRRYRRGRTPADEQNCFSILWNLVGRLLDFVRVDIRFNLDPGNLSDLLPFVERAETAGWFARRFPAVLQPARLSAYSERSSFLREASIATDEYDAIRRRLRDHAAGRFRVEESEAPDGVPEPRGSVCAALARDSVVVGAEGHLYRCGLQVGERGRAVDSLRGLDREAADRLFWENFDPTLQPHCSRCSFLPVCWGGCPKKHLEHDADALGEQSAYWRSNLPRLIANAAGIEISGETTFSEGLQFRDGYRPPPRPLRRTTLRVLSSVCGT